MLSGSRLCFGITRLPKDTHEILYLKKELPLRDEKRIWREQEKR